MIANLLVDVLRLRVDIIQTIRTPKRGAAPFRPKCDEFLDFPRLPDWTEMAKNCWKEDSDERPRFKMMSQYIQQDLVEGR